MARYIGPKARISRRFGEPILGSNHQVLTKRNYPAGQHGQASKRAKKSNYGLQLDEKQKAKYIYGILEKQFRNYYKKAKKREGITDDLFMQLLETRLDNAVYRLGLAPTRRAARQLVSHKHIKVNGRLLNIPSYAVKIDDIITVAIKDHSVIESALAQNKNTPDWIAWDLKTRTAKILSLPTRDEIPETINAKSIVEYYSK